MSPRMAIESPVFWFYVALAGGLLVLASLVLAAFQFGLRENVSHAWQAFRGWLAMAPLLLVVYFWDAKRPSRS